MRFSIIMGMTLCFATSSLPCLQSESTYRSFANNEEFSVIDIVSLLRFMLYKQTTQYINNRINICADINRDGNIDIIDLVSFLRTLLEKQEPASHHIAIFKASTSSILRLLLIAGNDSHGDDAHEHESGIDHLQSNIESVFPIIPVTKVYESSSSTEKLNALVAQNEAIVYFGDGDGRDVLTEKISPTLLENKSIGAIHYAVDPDVTKNSNMLKWIGGVYEEAYSVNPIWTANFQSFPVHPITKGITQFSIEDEWYFNIRFRETYAGANFTRILVAKPSDQTRDGPYVNPPGPYKHIQDRKGQEETLMWSIEEDGRRGFGFTGGHYHINWENPNFSNIVVNAIAWLSGALN